MSSRRALGAYAQFLIGGANLAPGQRGRRRDPLLQGHPKRIPRTVIYVDFESFLTPSADKGDRFETPNPVLTPWFFGY